jgi:type I restriction enzyme S subunit
VKVGAIRKQEQLSEVNASDELFKIPASWCWVRLSHVLTKLTDGTHHSPPNEPEGEFMYVTAKNIKPEGISVTNITYVSAEVHSEIYGRCNPEKGDILYIKDGATTGVVTINNLDQPFSMLSSVALLKLSTCLNNRLVVEFLRSPFFYGQMRGFMKGAAIPRVTLKRMAPAHIPLPPLAEQHRIVAKVDELMALCDELAAAQIEREVRRDRLVAASLNRIGTAPAAAETVKEAQTATSLLDAARFHLYHLSRLSTRPEHIKQLRQTILNLAVRGRLVVQDTNDELATDLLKRRELEKNSATPFSIPTGWVWTTVGEVAETRLGKMLDKAKNKGTPRRYLRNVNVRWFDFNLSDVLEMRFEDSELDEFSLHKGDVLICEGGEPGRAAVWDEREGNIYFQKAIHRVRFTKEVNSHYFVNVLRQAADSGRLSSYFTGVGIKHFTGKGLASFFVPLPPPAEQHRIVARVDQLMALCDQLETQLTTTQTDSRRLLEAVLRDALEISAVATG